MIEPSKSCAGLTGRWSPYNALKIPNFSQKEIGACKYCKRQSDF
jgi:hypothetical protein